MNHDCQLRRSLKCIKVSRGEGLRGEHVQLLRHVLQGKEGGRSNAQMSLHPGSEGWGKDMQVEGAGEKR